jgi:hypothetical protein
MCFSSPKAPKLPPPTVATEQAETQIDEAGVQAKEGLRKRLRALSGYSSTALTGGGGPYGTPSVGKTSLGA